MRRSLALFLLFLLMGSAVAQTSAKKSRRTPPKPTPVAPTEDDREAIGKRLQQILDAWSTRNAQQAAPYYAKDADLIFFDITPVEYKGWDAYAEGIEKLFANYESVDFRLNGDAVVHQTGPIAYATATWDALATLKDQTKQHFTVRWTIIMEKRGSEWLVVHEHASVPLNGLTAAPSTNQEPK